LKRRHKLQAAFLSLAIALVAIEFPFSADSAARFAQAPGAGRGADLRRDLARLAVGPAHETALPEWMAWVELRVLQATPPIVHLADKLGEGALLRLHERLSERGGLHGDEGRMLVLAPPGTIERQCFADHLGLPGHRLVSLTEQQCIQRGADMLLDKLRRVGGGRRIKSPQRAIGPL